MYLVLYQNSRDAIDMDGANIVEWPDNIVPPTTYFGVDADYVRTNMVGGQYAAYVRIALVPAIEFEQLPSRPVLPVTYIPIDTETRPVISGPFVPSDELISRLRRAIANAYNLPPGYLWGLAPEPVAGVGTGEVIIDDPEGPP